MLKSSGFKEKLYINDKALCIVGDGIRLARNQSPNKCYANKNSKSKAEVPEATVPADHKKKSETDKRRTFKLNVKDFENFQVCSKQLRQIYETVVVEDFERILKSLYARDVQKKRRKTRADEIIARIKPDEVYEQFFGQDYAHLNNIINKS